MWVSEDYILDENERSFSIKINVYGKDNYQSARKAKEILDNILAVSHEMDVYIS